MIPISLLLTSHFIGDFLLQSDWMAVNKSKSWKALTLHVWLYSFCFTWLGLTFFAFTFLTHFLTDAVTSRITSRLWFIDLTPSTGLHRCSSDGYYTLVSWKRHWFFVVIGLDQLIHAITLIWTYNLLYKVL